MKIHLILVLAALVACATAKPKPAPAPAAPAPEPPKSLYERLGGQAGIEAVVGQLVANVGADPRINYFFGLTDIGGLRDHLVAFVCVAAGGPCRYRGRTMGEAHRGLGITGDQFDALVEDLVKALEQFHVGEREKGELLAALGPLKPQIVEAH
jgi:hemoglobin